MFIVTIKHQLTFHHSQYNHNRDCHKTVIHESDNSVALDSDGKN